MSLIVYYLMHSGLAVWVLRIALSSTSLTNTIPDSILPLMVARLILSLKKAAKTPSTVWSADQVSTIMFAQRTIGGSERRGDNIL